MARKLRMEYPGASYHLSPGERRGDQRDDIFLHAINRHDFIRTLAHACQKTGWPVQAYCLMPNHYRLVMETPRPNPPEICML